MASGNINLRDPVLYRILHATHPRTGDAWCIYPTYDFAHGQSDAIEGVTHSLCTLEFEDHRPLYDWLIEHLPVPSRPRQYEFARLNLSHTILSKRRLIQLVEEGHVRGWDDPRMPTLAGLRRRGVPPAAIREFARRIGVAKSDNLVDVALLEHCVREVLNRTAERRMAVLRPLKVVIENYPEGQTEEFEAINNPEDPAAGTRRVPFSRELFIERNDFMEEPPRGFFRLAPGREVRLRYAYLITCREVERAAAGNVARFAAPTIRRPAAAMRRTDARSRARCTGCRPPIPYPPRCGCTTTCSTSAEPGADGDFLADLDPRALEILTDCRLEPSLAAAVTGEAVQFERQGYFCRDPDATPERPVFNRTVALRDTWAKLQTKAA